MVKTQNNCLWNIAAMVYVICNITFCAGNLVILNSLSMYFFLAISFLHIIRKRYIQLYSLYGIVHLILFGILLTFSMLYAPYSDYSKSFANDTLYDYITMLVILFCFSQYMKGAEEIRKFWLATFIGGVTLSIYVFEMYGADFWHILRANSVASNNNIARIGTGFVNTNTIGIYTSISMCIGIYYALFSENVKHIIYKIAIIVASIVCFIMAMASGSKKSFVIMFTFWIAIFVYKQIGSKKILRGIKYLLIFVGSVIIISTLIQRMTIFSGIATRMDNFLDFIQFGKGSASDLERSSFISQGIKYWMKSPILGNGLGSSVYYMGMYAHNNFVEILMSLGILGFAIFYYPIISSIINDIKSKMRTKEENELSILSFALLVTAFVCGVAAVYYFDRYWMILIYSSIFMYRNNAKKF